MHNSTNNESSHPPATGKILVTGGTGFLGAYILQNLVNRGLSVRAIRRSSRLPFFIPQSVLEKVEWVEGDVLDIVSLEDAMKGVHSLIHAAALVSFSKHSRKKMYQVNVEGTANVVNVAIDSGIQRMLHVSSVAALGRTVKGDHVNEKKKWETSSQNTHYAISKHDAEMHVWRGFGEGLEGVIMNPGTILGFGDWHTSSCAIFRNAWQEFPWYTEGINGFVGVEDAAEAAVRLLLSPLNHERFIVTSGNWSFRELFETIAKNFGKKVPSRKATPALGEIAWRMESLRSVVTGKPPLLTRETAKLAHTRTYFENDKIITALPNFNFSPLAAVVKTACARYKEAMKKGDLTL